MLGMRTIPWTGDINIETALNALEAVITDEATREAGLWQGEMIPRAIRCLEELAARLRPIPVTERLPGPEKAVLALLYNGEWMKAVYWDGAWHEAFWDRFETRPFDIRITHWLPLPPKPE